MGCRYKAGYIALLALPVIFLSARAQDVIGAPVFPVEHPECVLFGPQFDQFVAKAVGSNGLTPHQVEVGALTSAVAAALPKVPPGSRTDSFEKQMSAGSIDAFVFGAFQAAGVSPAP